MCSPAEGMLGEMCECPSLVELGLPRASASITKVHGVPWPCHPYNHLSERDPAGLSFTEPWRGESVPSCVYTALPMGPSITISTLGRAEINTIWPYRANPGYYRSNHCSKRIVLESLFLYVFRFWFYFNRTIIGISRTWAFRVLLPFPVWEIILTLPSKGITLTSQKAAVSFRCERSTRVVTDNCFLRQARSPPPFLQHFPACQRVLLSYALLSFSSSHMGW